MKRGGQAVCRMLKKKEYQYVDDMCRDISIELIKSMGGASGIIFGTMFLGGVKFLPHSGIVDVKTLSRYFEEGERSIEIRGKSKPGNKTMLDALHPACVAMQEALQESADAKEMFWRGYKGAERGVEYSKTIRSAVGRSKNFREKTIGIPDPGAVSVSLWFQGFYETIELESEKGEALC